MIDNLPRSAGSFSKSDLAEAVMDDVGVEERAPGKFSQYRRCLVAVFVERFLTDIKVIFNCSTALNIKVGPTN